MLRKGLFGVWAQVMHLSTTTSGHQQKNHTTSEIVCFFVCCRMCLWKVVTPSFPCKIFKTNKKECTSSLVPSMQWIIIHCSLSSFIHYYFFSFQPPHHDTTLTCKTTFSHICVSVNILSSSAVSSIGGSKWQEACIPMFCRTGVLILTCLTIVIAHLIN